MTRIQLRTKAMLFILSGGGEIRTPVLLALSVTIYSQALVDFNFKFQQT